LICIIHNQPLPSIPSSLSAQAIEVLMDPRLARQALDSQFALETDMSKRLQRVEIDGKLPVPSGIKRVANKKSSPLSDMLTLQSSLNDSV
jgi:hypothetical protein